MHFIFSQKLGLINYSGGNYNPLVLLQSPSEELRVLYKYELINRPSNPAGRRQLLSLEDGALKLPGLGLPVLWCQGPGLPGALCRTAICPRYQRLKTAWLLALRASNDLGVPQKKPLA